MKICTSTNIVFEREDGSRIPMETSIELCAQAGYKEMDLCFVDMIAVKTPFTTDAWKDYVIKLGDLANSLGIVFTQAHAPIHDFCNDIEGYNMAYEWVKRSIEGAALLGIKWIVMHPSTKVVNEQLSDMTHDENVKYFKEIASYAKKFNIGIAIENMWGRTKEGVKRYGTKSQELKKLIEDIGLENVGACWDTEHGAIEGIDQPAAICLLGDYLKATHISDMTSEKHVHILPYVGFVEWEEIYKAFAMINYCGVFAFEMQHYLLRMPYKLIPEALKMSYNVGEYMIERINFYKHSNK